MSQKTRLWARLLVCFSLLLGLFLPVGVRGAVRDLGVVARIYPISEKDMEEYLKEKAAQVDPGWIKSQIAATARKAAMPDFHLPGATETRVKHIDPSIVVTEDIKDHLGNVLYAKGTVVNPLDHVFLTKAYIIINGREEEQIRFANEFKEPKMVLLTEGDPFAVEQKLGKEVYAATLPVLQRFEIGHLPAVVTQEGRLIRVEEVALK